MIEYKYTPAGSDKWLPKDWEDFYKQYRQDVKLLPSAIARNILRGLLLIERSAKVKYLTGGHPLKVQTGRLRASVHSQIKQEGPIITGTVGTDVFYGKIHEEGGEFIAKAREVQSYKRKLFKTYISKKTGKLMHVQQKVREEGWGEAAGTFRTVGKTTTVKGHKAGMYLIRFKKRPWLEPAVRDNIQQMRERLANLGFSHFQKYKKQTQEFGPITPG